jgi:hypothetical protein
MGYAEQYNNDMRQASLTPNQKLEALAQRFYCGGIRWEPKVGDYYTSSRNDLELYQIVDEDELHFYTVYCTNPDGERAKWRKDEFTAEGFGLNRVWVHESIFKL